MKKIGIITIIDNNNYGNRLQCFALNRYCKLISNDIQILTLKNDSYSNQKKLYLFRVMREKILKNKEKYESHGIRRQNFNLFDKEISYFSKRITCYSNLNSFDYLIVGSDQVWNPNYRRLRDVDLLTIVPGNKRIAFSASFGVNDIPDKIKPRVANELKKFKAISVREDRGKEIVEELTGRKDVEVLVDPTMLLTSEEWDKVSKKPKMLKTDKYILNYFLGELSEKRKKEIQKVAQENNCEIINILDKNSPFYECGPSEFIYLEKHAFLICTDSFHSSVFAILYNRPFIVFDREQKNVANMNSRLETLLNKFKLENRKYKDKITKENLKHDYTEAYKILERERLKADKFLRKALDIKDSD